MRIKLALLITAVVFTAAASAEPLTISGPARVVDADTVVIQNGDTSSFRDGAHVRLKGVDAAEMNTDLGRAAKVVMETIIGGGPLTCPVRTGEKTWKRDVGFCTTAEGVDINREIIEQGAALACPRYSTRYVEFEQPNAVAAQQRAHYCVERHRR